VADESGYAAMGGSADNIGEAMSEQWNAELDQAAAIRLARDVLSADRGVSLAGDQLEVAALERSRPRRAFRRINGARLTEILSG